MKQFKIKGNKTLTGTIEISGAKNSAVALIPAAILSDEEVVIDNIPDISDINDLNEIMLYLNAKVERDGATMKICTSTLKNKEIPEKISSKLRASYYFMSALLAKYKKVEMYFPGGCSIGARPIDQTLKGFRLLGAKVVEQGNKFTITAKELKGNNIYLDMPSVGATVNCMLVATKAKGVTVIENAAKEPEIVNIATFLNNMGAKIIGAGTSKITITGVERLGSAYTEVIPDRIEAGTYIILGALIGKKLKISSIIPKHLNMLISKMREMGVDMEVGEDYVVVSKTDNLKPVKIKTLGYPGFATDLQQPITTLLTRCHGTSELEETIYENRFNNVPWLNSLGADIKIKDRKIYVTGPSKLKGRVVTATDLRAGACLVLAALISSGETTITNVEYVLRGYENIVDKLTSVGARIELEEI